MTSTVPNLVTQAIAGLIGADVAAVVVHEHSFGKIGHTVTGLIGGRAQRLFPATAVGTVGNGANMARASPDPVSQAILEVGLAGGAGRELVVGFLKHSLEHHRSEKP